MRTLLVNLTRFGDLLQTQPVIHGLTQNGHQVRMVCLQNFAGAAQLLPGLDGVYPLPGSALMAGMDAGWPKALSEYWRWLRMVGEDFKPELVLNLIPSLPSRLLVRALAPEGSATAIGGYAVDSHGYSLNGSRWAVYMQAASALRGASPFNLVDIFRRMAGLPPAWGKLGLQTPDLPQLEGARHMLGPADKGYVGLQLGASEDRRRWPVAHFAALGDALHRTMGITPVLLGGPGESHLGERYAAVAQEPFVNCIGRTDLVQLAAVVAQLRLLVSNDTGTMHLAAGLDVPVTAIFLATAQPWDTGPYRPDCLCLEPDMACHPCDFGTSCGQGNACRAVILPQHVLPSVMEFLTTGAWPSREITGARSWLSTVDAQGYLDLGRLPLGSGQDGQREAWAKLQRRLYRGLLDGNAVEQPEPASEAASHVELAELAQLAGRLTQSRELMDLLIRQAQLLGVSAKPGLKARFLGFWQSLLANLDSEPRLKVLGTMLMHEMQEKGEDLTGLIACLEDYRQLMAGLEEAAVKAGMDVDNHFANARHGKNVQEGV